MSNPAPVANTNNILDTVKTGLGIAIDDTSFDSELLIHINSVVINLAQLGLPISEGVEIDENTEWDSFVENITSFQSVKQYFVLKVRVVFDPPASSYVLDSFNRTLSEIEWRLNTAAES